MSDNVDPLGDNVGQGALLVAQSEGRRPRKMRGIRERQDDKPPRKEVEHISNRPELGLRPILTQDAEEAVSKAKHSSCLLCKSELDIKVYPVNTAYYGQLFTSICSFCKAQRGAVRMVASVALNMHTALVSTQRVKTRRKMWASYLAGQGARQTRKDIERRFGEDRDVEGEAYEHLGDPEAEAVSDKPASWDD